MTKRCALCGKVPEDWGDEATKEHLVPTSRGGGNGSNRVMACKGCNGAKGDMTLEEFKYFLREQRFHPDYIAHIEAHRYKHVPERLKRRRRWMKG